MKDITHKLGTFYHPYSALVFYRNAGCEMYVEHFDMDGNGNPINAHPLTIAEAQRLARSLTTVKADTAKPLGGIIGSHILHIHTPSGRVMWFTKATERELHFAKSLNIPSGKAQMPPLLWCADSRGLSVFALRSNRRPTENTALYHAPFFNIYQDGSVCMGSVKVNIGKNLSLAEFTSAWEGYFFNSYFSHLAVGASPTKENCALLWEKLISQGGNFPMRVLKKSSMNIKKLLS